MVAVPFSGTGDFGIKEKAIRLIPDGQSVDKPLYYAKH